MTPVSEISLISSEFSREKGDKTEIFYGRLETAIPWLSVTFSPGDTFLREGFSMPGTKEALPGGRASFLGHLPQFQLTAGGVHGDGLAGQ